MGKEIRLILEYQCYPIWIYDENSDFIDNDLPKEIRDNKTLVNMIEEIQQEFDLLYLNNNKEFKYVGFKTPDQKKKFKEKVLNLYEKLSYFLQDKYVIKNMIDVDKL